MTMFRKATRTQSKLRLAIAGVSGSGKTMTALRIAQSLGARVAVIDTEFGSASKYAGERVDGSEPLDFDVLELSSFGPQDYIRAIHDAEVEAYDVVIIDSLTHAWSGKGGALELVDAAAARSRSGNTYTAWREVTPQHNALVEAMVRCRAHLIATMRSKADYALAPGKDGKHEVRKVGTAPIQREGMEYEFDVFADMDLDHNLLICKTRCVALDKRVFSKPGPEIAGVLKSWLSDGAPDPFAEASKGLAKASTMGDLEDLARSLIRICGKNWTAGPWVEFQDRAKALGLNPRVAVEIALKEL